MMLYDSDAHDKIMDKFQHKITTVAFTHKLVISNMQIVASQCTIRRMRRKNRLLYRRARANDKKCSVDENGWQLRCPSKLRSRMLGYLASCIIAHRKYSSEKCANRVLVASPFTSKEGVRRGKSLIDR